MTLAELRQTVELLPPGASITLPRETLLDALREQQEHQPTNGRVSSSQERDDPEILLDAPTVAARLGTSERWVYDHSEALGGRRLSRRCLRFPETAVRLYLKRLR